ncbi:reverse transcriptase domain-containing protein [Tanacetum coccineum]
MGVKNLQANVDSWLVANQVNGSYIVKELGIIKYLEKVRALISAFKEFSIKQVPRGENKKADALSKMASTSFAHLSKQVLVEELKEKSIDEKEVLAVVEEKGRTWMNLIHEYLTKEILPEEKRKARAICHKGIDIAGTFPEGPGKVKFLIVAMDYFTKWIVEKPMATITGAQIKKFVWDNIICRFGLPGEIISKNGKQFRDNPFKDWCEILCIRQCFASVKHSQANGLVERENRSLGEGIKARVRNTSFKPGDLVYQNNEASHAEDGGKLEPRWEGPYEVTEALGKGAYKLRDRNGNILPRTWDVRNLKKMLYA